MTTARRCQSRWSRGRRRPGGLFTEARFDVDLDRGVISGAAGARAITGSCPPEAYRRPGPPTAPYKPLPPVTLENEFEGVEVARLGRVDPQDRR